MTDTLKSICAQCDHLKSPQLDFIPVEPGRHREIILRDLRELVSAASAKTEMHKTVVILGGCILEAVLYSFLQAQEAFIAGRRGEFQFDPNLGLRGYINVFNRWFRDLLPNVELPDALVTYRDLVHFNRELNSPPGICARAAPEMLEVLDRLLSELSQFAGPVQGQAVATE